MSLLRWHGAVDSDRAALMSFTCTEPPRRRKVPPYGLEHDREWELVVQRYIRDLRPPYRHFDLWVGYDDEGIGAVAAAENFGTSANVFASTSIFARCGAAFWAEATAFASEPAAAIWLSLIKTCSPSEER